MKMKKMEAIPQEITLEILKRLPAKSLYRFKCVSKDWLSAISDSRFIDSHYDHSRSNPRLLLLGPDPLYLRWSTEISPGCHHRRSLHSAHCSRSLRDKQLTATHHGLYFDTLEGPFHVWQSVHGLICISTSGGGELGICNPSTREFLKLKTRWAEAGRCIDHLSTSSILFGFDPVEKKHKVLNSCRKKESYYMANYVYTLGENKWRKIEIGSVHRMSSRQSCCIDGVIYYVAAAGDGIWRVREHFLLAFDVRLEIFREICLPEGTDFEQLGKWLYECGGRLVLLGCGDISRSMNEPTYVGKGAAMWVLEDVGKPVWSLVRVFALPSDLDWSKMCEISTDRIRTGEILFTQRSCNPLKAPFELHCYNLEDGNVRSIEVHGLQLDERPSEYIMCGFSNIRVRSYVENLRSLKDLAGNNVEQF